MIIHQYPKTQYDDLRFYIYNNNITTTFTNNRLYSFNTSDSNTGLLPNDRASFYFINKE